MAYENVTPLRETPQTPRPSKLMEEQPTLNLRDQFLKLRRRKWVILSTMFLLTLLTVLVLEQLQPQYRASAYVMLEARKQQTLDIESVLGDAPADLEMIQSELAVITSRGVAEKVIRKLGLDTTSEFNPRLAEAENAGGFDPVGWVRGQVKAAMAYAGLGGGDEPELPPEQREAENWIKTVNNVLDNLEASPRGRSRVIQISFTSVDRERAARVANAFAQQYIIEHLDAKFEAAQRASQWLNDRLSNLRTQTEAAERRAAEFRQRAGLLQGQGTTTLAQQNIGQLSTELITARSALTTAEARLRQAEPALGAGAATLPGAVLESALIQRLQEQVITLQRRMAEISGTYGARHPTMINLRAELGEAESRLRAEIGKVISGLRNEVQVNRTRVQSLEAELRRLEQEAGTLGQSEAQLRSLESEATANRTLLDQLTSRLNETTLQQDLQQPEVRMLSEAPVPQAPAFPNKKLIAAVALVLSALLGVALALLIEHLDHGFRSAEQLSRATDLPTLGLVPSIGRIGAGRPENAIVDKPRSSYGEAVSSTLASLFLASNERRPKLVLVTSTLPNEGKTTLTLSLARAAAQSGLKVLLVDADLRRPTLHRRLEVPQQPGFTDVLLDKAAFADVVRKDPKSTVSFLSAGSQVPNPLHFLGAERTRQFLHGLGKYYDLILIDSSPVMAVSDSRILCRYVDQTVFVVRWAKTRREQTINAMRQLVEAGGRIGGVVLSMVNVRRHAQYAFGDSGQYYIASKYYEG